MIQERRNQLCQKLLKTRSSKTKTEFTIEITSGAAVSLGKGSAGGVVATKSVRSKFERELVRIN